MNHMILLRNGFLYSEPAKPIVMNSGSESASVPAARANRARSYVTKRSMAPKSVDHKQAMISARQQKSSARFVGEQWPGKGRG